MAKKAGRRPARPAARTRKAGPTSRRGTVRKTAGARTRTAKTARPAKTARKKAAPAARRRTAAVRKPVRRSAPARASKSLTPKKKAAAKRPAPPRKAVKRPAPKAAAPAPTRTPAPPKVRTKRAAAAVPASAPVTAKPKRAANPPPGAAPARKAPGLQRERRRLREIEDGVPTPPSSLNFDQGASAARSGREEMREERLEHTETSPVLTAGDVDANWEDAYAVGDEAPGGDNMTPDQDRVDDIGRALGVQYEDNEELKGSDKIADRDKHRWELDPASSDDYLDRD